MLSVAKMMLNIFLITAITFTFTVCIWPMHTQSNLHCIEGTDFYQFAGNQTHDLSVVSAMLLLFYIQECYI